MTSPTSTSYKQISLNNTNKSNNNIYIGEGLFHNISDLLKHIKTSSYVIITDTNVLELYGRRLQYMLQHNLNITTYIYAIPAGERHKTRITKQYAEDFLLDHHLTRDAFILTLGGGVVGDMGGYIASTYLRSIRYAHIPTSLLAMVDSSIGGKTGVDTKRGKNLIGAFHQPYAIYIDPLLLKTLPSRHISNGMAEIIKTAVIYNDDLFHMLMNESQRIRTYNMHGLKHIIYETASIKVEITRKDQKEHGLRSILNFGHSLGHAIEAIMMPKLLHGECVSIGMILEAELSYMLGYLPSWNTIHQLKQCCEAYKLPIKIPETLQESSVKLNHVLEKLSMDKKNRGNDCKMVMLCEIGSVRSNPSYTTIVPLSTICQILCKRVCIKRPRSTPINGNLNIPGSKSISNRVLLLAALGQGVCHIKHLLHSHDTKVMLNALKEFGVHYELKANDTIVINGTNGRLKQPKSSLFLGNAGTASRFLTTMCNIIPASATTNDNKKNNDNVVLYGIERMHERPIDDLVNALNKNGCNIEYIGKNKKSLPLCIHLSKNGWNGGRIELAANVSSQFVSSILLSAPYAKNPVKLVLSNGDVVSQPYIDMTCSIMRDFGINVVKKSSHEYHIPCGYYRNPSSYMVEGDATSSTYMLAIAAVTGGTITISNVSPHSSKQGDAQFCRVLHRMGCKITSTDTTITVSGPPIGTLRGCGRIDMSTMTDSFLTLCVVAAVAKGTTTMTNISNQRVKECNRIAAMVRELTKCNIDAVEIIDGIKIRGNFRAIRALSHVNIDCYDDHRIAMSFGVLGLISGSSIIINDKYCVNKTYPQYWAQLIHDLKINVCGVINDDDDGVGSENKIAPSVLQTIELEQQPSIILIGMRGAGKSTLGAAISKYLGRKLIDIDKVVETVLDCSIKEYVKTRANGWKEFRYIELECLKEALKNHYNGCVIVCGGGIIETSECIDLLKQQKIVITITRCIDDICTYLQEDRIRPSFNDNIYNIYKRRQSLYENASNYEFIMINGDDNIHIVCNEFIHFVCNILNVDYTSHGQLKRLSLNRNTYFLSLTAKDVIEYAHMIHPLTIGIDALELRVDLLKSQELLYIQQQHARLRRLSHLPIIFTIRTRSQGGKAINNPVKIFSLLKWAMRLGIPYIDIESHWNHQLLTDLWAYRQSIHSKCEFIVSAHIIDDNGGNDASLWNLFNQCYRDGDADIIKVVVSAVNDEYDAIRILDCSQRWLQQLQSICPYDTLPRIIVLAMGKNGQLSRILNRVLTPVTHALLNQIAAPGQMSINEIIHARKTLGLRTKQQYYLFGSPIAKSPSPTMHNSGFKQLAIDHTHIYELCETTAIEKVHKLVIKPEFAGASVTIPLKERVLDIVDCMTTAARTIGAINTLYRRHEDGALCGDNTDWLGIVHPLIPLMNKDDVKRTRALIIGAGGTSRAAIYALKYMGFSDKKRLKIYNPRTPKKAQLLANEFDIDACDHINTLKNISIIICTLPGSVGYVLPDELLSLQRPIIFDVSYLPKITNLGQQAVYYNCPLVRGIDMLVAQGVAAFNIWTSGRAPAVYGIMSESARNFYKNVV